MPVRSLVITEGAYNALGEGETLSRPSSRNRQVPRGVQIWGIVRAKQYSAAHRRLYEGSCTFTSGVKSSHSSVMSKKPDSSGVGWGHGYLINEHATGNVEGRIFTLMEALGLPNRQEEALKVLVRQAIWSMSEDAIYVSPESHTRLRGEYLRKKKEADSKGEPMRGI